MTLSSLGLDAFFEVVRAKSFSQAAKNLHLSQSALSQRVLKLEEELQTTLLVRDPKGLRLTEPGEHLIRYCQLRQTLEEDVSRHFSSEKTRDGELSGTLRVAGHSTVTRSVVMPALTSLVKDHPRVKLQIFTREMRDLTALLRSGEVDMVVLDHAAKLPGICHHVLGFEENVLVEAAKGGNRAVFLDHDAEDTTTLEFFRRQEPKNRPANLERMFLDEIYSILDAVALGWGRAVIPRHLALSRENLAIMRGFRAFKVSVVLNYYQQSFYTPLIRRGRETLCSAAKKYL